MRRRFRTSRFDHYDGLVERNLSCRGEKGARVADGLHVKEDAVCLGIVSEKRNQVSPAHVQHRTGGDDRAESDLFLETPVEDGCEERAALAEKSYVSGTRDF